MWHIETSGNICSPQDGLQHTHCAFSVNNGEALASHYGDVIMSMIASQITSLMIVYSDADQRKHQSSTSLAFARGIHRGPVNSPHKWPVTQKMFPFDDVIMSLFVGMKCSCNVQLTDDYRHSDGLIKPHKWKCPILSQFHKGYIIHIWHFRYGQECRQWVDEMNSASCECGNFPAPHRWAMQKGRPLIKCAFIFLFSIHTKS